MALVLCSVEVKHSQAQWERAPLWREARVSARATVRQRRAALVPLASPEGWMAVCSLWFQVLLLSLSSVHSDIFTSIGQMTDLLLTEKTLIASLRHYIQEEEDRLDTIKQWADKLDDISKVAIQDPEGYLGHPVNAFKLIKRLSTEWAGIDNLVLTNLTDKFTSVFNTEKQDFPNVGDQIGVAKALMRLQDTYKLDPETITTGKLPGSSPDPSYRYIMTVDDCFDLGKVAFDEADYHHAWLWLTQALKMLDEGQKLDIVDEFTILDYLSYSAFQEGDFKGAVAYTERLLELDPDHKIAIENLEKYEFELFKKMRTEQKMKKRDKKEEQEEKEGQSGDTNDFKKIYEALCRGEGLNMTPKRQSRLFCRYHDNSHPQYIIGPVKQEDEWDQPLIVRYHDIVTDYEIKKIKELAKPRLRRAMVDGIKSGTVVPIPVESRIAQSAWLRVIDHPVIARINQRIEDITGLDMTTAEDMQVGNYGVGGQYEPHYDFRLDPDPYKELGTGNRIATWLTYMSDVAAGGATVFPDLGVSLSPIKGSAVLWYNLFLSGQGDLKTRHAACPVLVGSKWVSNKWIHERGQEFRRRCGLKETD